MHQVEHIRLIGEDAAGVQARADLHTAVLHHDMPYVPGPSRRDLLETVAHQFPGGDNEHWLAYVAGEVVGSTLVHLPRYDNPESATVEVLVHPAHRRAGIGRQLVEHTCELARADQRRRVITEIREDGPGMTAEDMGGVALARSLGAQRALPETRRRLDLTTLERATTERLLASAEAASKDYHLLRWHDAVPEEVIEGVVTLESRMVEDAPMGDLAWEPQVVNADRWRAMEATVKARGRHTYGCAAIHTATGAVTGYTLCAIAEDVPDHAGQWATIVLPGHRGHRLGLRLKAANLLNLQEGEAEVRTIDTWNAIANRPMIAVNEALGFRVLDTWAEWQLDLG